MSKSGSSVSNAYNNKILDLARYNGRVNLMEEPDSAIQFQIAEKVAIKNKATEYRGAIAGEWEDNTLSCVFFLLEICKSCKMQFVRVFIRCLSKNSLFSLRIRIH